MIKIIENFKMKNIHTGYGRYIENGVTVGIL